MDARARSFISAARKGDVVAMERLVLEEEQQGRDPSRLVNAQDEDGWSALMKACRGARPESVRFLLQRGAEVRLLNRWGADALHWSCREGRSLEVVQLMMGQAGADPWLRTAQSGKNALMAAAEHGHTDIVRLLLLLHPQQGGGPGGVDQVDRQGRTALWLACRYRHAAVARLLVWRPEGGGRPADVCARDHSGCTPWQAYRRPQGSSHSPRHHDEEEDDDDEAMERFFRVGRRRQHAQSPTGRTEQGAEGVGGVVVGRAGGVGGGEPLGPAAKGPMAG